MKNPNNTSINASTTSKYLYIMYTFKTEMRLYNSLVRVTVNYWMDEFTKIRQNIFQRNRGDKT